MFTVSRDVAFQESWKKKLITPPERVVSWTLRRPALSGTFSRNDASELPGWPEFGRITGLLRREIHVSARLNASRPMLEYFATKLDGVGAHDFGDVSIELVSVRRQSGCCPGSHHRRRSHPR